MKNILLADLISVIIPCFNQGEYIDEAVDSVLNQTYKNVEIIIVNDGSTEKFTITKLTSYKKPKTLVLNKQNGHLSSARNYGIKHGKGSYILILDADDMFESTFIEKAKKILDENESVGAVSSQVENFGAKTGLGRKFEGGSTKDFVVINNAVACALIRKKAWEEVGGYDETMKNGFEDWSFWLAITKNGWRIEIIPEPLFKYRRKNISMLQESQSLRPELVKVIVKKHRDVFEKYLEDAIYGREIIIRDLKLEIALLMNSRYYKLVKFFSGAVKKIKSKVGRL